MQTPPATRATPEFDRYAESYNQDLNQALAASGEKKEYFAQKRLQWLAGCLRAIGERPRTAIDYGCGTGDTSAALLEQFHLGHIVGLEVSTASLEVARRTHHSDGLQFLEFQHYAPQANIDLVYCNGVFHHIVPAERPNSIRYIWNCLRPGGFFALWENNPWNPGTRYVMSHCVFDKDAITLSPRESVRMLRVSGFEITKIDFLFIFPRILKVLRFLEPHLSRLPLGGQYQILCRKPLR